MAKLFYQQPGQKYVSKKSQKPRAWLWRRLAIWSVIINMVTLGYMLWMIYE